MHFLNAFLESARFELENYQDSELILLDNGSSDNSVSFVMNEYPWVKLIKSSRNLGFALGCHVAAKESKADYLIFVNNDMKLEPGFIDEILKPFEIESNIGAVGGLILNETGTQIDFAGGDSNLFGWGFQKYHGEPASLADELFDKNQYPQQFFVCGGTLAISREIWEFSGGFDEDYFAFFEDVDFGWRLNLMGLKNILAPKARVRHKHHGTAISMPESLRTFLLERNALFSIIKNYDESKLAKIFPWAIAMINERALIDQSIEAEDIFHGRWYEDLWNSRNIRDSDIMNEIKNIKEISFSRAKKIIKRTQERPKHNARLLAIEDVFNKMEKLIQKREKIQDLRKPSDEEIINLMGEPYRTVMGHEREKKLMEEFKKYV